MYIYVYIYCRTCACRTFLAPNSAVPTVNDSSVALSSHEKRGVSNELESAFILRLTACIREI